MVSKYVLQFVPPLTLVVMRFAIAPAVLGTVLAFAKKPLHIWHDDRKYLALYGFVGYTVSIGAQFAGTALSSPHMGAVITSASPAVIAIFAYWLLKERLNWQTVGALSVATAGVMIVIGMDPQNDSGTFAGNLFLVVAAVSWVLFSVMGKKID